MKTKHIYTITLKNGKKVTIWFAGDILEQILDDYEIPYTREEHK